MHQEQAGEGEGEAMKGAWGRGRDQEGFFMEAGAWAGFGRMNMGGSDCSGPRDKHVQRPRGMRPPVGRWVVG